MRSQLVTALVLTSFLGASPNARAASGQAPAPTEKDIVTAYHYMLGRWLVLRQETLDFRERFHWNEILHREPGGVAWANPNLDVAYSEAWIYVDPTSCTLVDVPEIHGRYYTLQVMNGWAEVITNINERNFPKHPSGTFALCLKGSKVALPTGAQRIDLPGRKSRMLARIELAADPAEAIALQKRMTLRPTGSPQPEKVIVELDFPNDRLPGVEGFDHTEEILASELDINPGMATPQRAARAVARAATDPAQRARIDEVIHRRAIPEFYASLDRLGRFRNGWARPRATGNFGSDFLMRADSNYAGIWSNNAKEVIYFTAQGVDGGKTFRQTYPRQALPTSKAHYFWSVIAVDGEKFQVIPNPKSRYLLNKQSPLKYGPDGSLTLVFAPTLPEGTADANWLPTPAGQKYNLTYRVYGPAPDVVSGAYYPPPLVEQR